MGNIATNICLIFVFVFEFEFVFLSISKCIFLYFDLKLKSVAGLWGRAQLGGGESHCSKTSSQILPIILLGSLYLLLRVMFEIQLNKHVFDFWDNNFILQKSCVGLCLHICIKFCLLRLELFAVCFGKLLFFFKTVTQDSYWGITAAIHTSPHNLHQLNATFCTNQCNSANSM